MTTETDTVDSEQLAIHDILREIRALRVDFAGLNDRVDACERQSQSSQTRQVPLSPLVHQSSNPDTSPAAIGDSRDRAPRTFEVQNAFTEVKDKYSGSKLPADLLFTTARKNVKSDDASVFQVLSKVAKYCETGLKVVTYARNSQDSNDGEFNEDCMIVFTALMRYVQDEGVQLVVNKNYDKDWATQYRAIMGGQTDVRAEHISAMDRTATMLKHRPEASATSGVQRGRSRGGRIRGRRDFNWRNSRDVRHNSHGRDWSTSHTSSTTTNTDE